MHKKSELILDLRLLERSLHPVRRSLRVQHKLNLGNENLKRNVDVNERFLMVNRLQYTNLSHHCKSNKCRYHFLLRSNGNIARKMGCKSTDSIISFGRICPYPSGRIWASLGRKRALPIIFIPGNQSRSSRFNRRERRGMWSQLWQASRSWLLQITGIEFGTFDMRVTGDNYSGVTRTQTLIKRGLLNPRWPDP